MQTERKQELSAYLTQHQNAFYRLAYSYTANREAALDVVQNAALKALLYCDTLRQQASMKTWFYRILVNESLSYLKKNSREILWEMEDLKEIPDTTKEEWHEETLTYAALMQLPEEMKTVIILRFYEDMTLSEISDVLGISLSNVKYRLYGGLKKMRSILEMEVNDQ